MEQLCAYIEIGQSEPENISISDITYQYCPSLALRFTVDLNYTEDSKQ